MTMLKRTNNCGELRLEDAGKKVVLAGWVQSYRDHGNLVFFDLRDREGLTQLVFDPEVRPEARPAGPDAPLRVGHRRQRHGPPARRGAGEPQAGHRGDRGHRGPVEVLNKARTPPFEIDGESKINEETRLNYRYIDLRRPEMQQRLRPATKCTTLGT